MTRHYQTRFFKPEDIRVLKLWKKFLSQGAEGTSLNLLSCQKPTVLAIANACPEGMGGFNMNTGKAWRMKFPTPLDNENITG
jgi:hypothetical protein